MLSTASQQLQSPLVAEVYGDLRVVRGRTPIHRPLRARACTLARLQDTCPGRQEVDDTSDHNP